MRAMDIVPPLESLGICQQSVMPRSICKAEADNLSSLCTYATCNLGFDMWRRKSVVRCPRITVGWSRKPDDYWKRTAVV